MDVSEFFNRPCRKCGTVIPKYPCLVCPNCRAWLPRMDPMTMAINYFFVIFAVLCLLMWLVETCMNLGK